MHTQIKEPEYKLSEKQEELKTLVTELYHDKLITITKKSGMNRAKSEGNRRKALEEYLTRESMTLDDYNRLEAQAKEPFYRNGDGSIVIPELHVISHLVQKDNFQRECLNSLTSLQE